MSLSKLEGGEGQGSLQGAMIWSHKKLETTVTEHQKTLEAKIK